MKAHSAMPVMQRPKSPITITSADPDPTQPSGRISPKMRNYIGVGVLAACLIIGGGIVWWLLLGSSPKRRTIAVDPNKQTVAIGGGGGMRIAQQRPRDLKGVNKLQDNRWFVRGDTGAMVVSRDNAGAYDFRFTFQNSLGLSTEQVKLLSARFRILQDPLMAKEWKITDDQTAKLKLIKMANSPLQPSGGDKEAVRQLWNSYLNASDGPARMDAQKKLTDKLDAVAKSNIDVAKKLYSERIEQIRQILTPEQVQTLTK